MFNKKHTKETKLKISNSSKNKPKSEEHRQHMCGKRLSVSGKNNPMYGRNGKKNPMYGKYDENSPAWKGGVGPLIIKIRNTENYSIWRSQIYKRDLYICQTCGKKSDGDLVAHHIERFAGLIRKYNIKTVKQAVDCNGLWDINNGITLCEECHSHTNNYKNRKIK